MSNENEHVDVTVENSGGTIPPPMYWGMDEKAYCTVLHLAQFANFVPMGGIILPLVMWLIHKDKSAVINEHGKHVMNWLISEFIYMIVLVFFGIFLFFALFVVIMVASNGQAAPLMFPLMFLAYIPVLCLNIVGIIFPIVGAVKANKGVCWKYPLTIPFIK